MTAVEQIPQCPVGDTRHAAARKDGKATGHPLCEKHYDRLKKMLREIETETGNLRVAPSIAITWNTGGGGHGGGGAPAFEQAPALLVPLVLTDTRHGEGISEDGDDRHAGGRIVPALVVLRELAARIRADRSIMPPNVMVTDCQDRWVLGGRPHGPYYGLPCRHPACSGRTVERRVFLETTIATECEVLIRQLEWVVQWPDIDLVFGRLRRLLGQLKAANGTTQQPVGQCPVDGDGGTRCRGPLWPSRPKHTVGEWQGSSPSAVQCEKCGTRWEGAGELARLALILETQRKERAAVNHAPPV